MIEALRQSPRLEILAFHRVMPGANKYFIPPMAIARTTFERLLTKLLCTYRIVGMEEAIRAMQAGALSQKSLALTFDDGYLDNFTLAEEFLLREGIPATFFLPVRQIDERCPYWWDYLKWVIDHNALAFWKWCRGSAPFAALHRTCRSLVRHLNNIGKAERDQFLSSVENEFGRYGGEKLLMDWDDTRTLCRQGFSIGSHSFSHEPMTDLPAEAAAAEIEQSRHALMARLPTSVAGFCYPRGAYSPALAKAVHGAGYAYAVTTRFGSNREGADVFALRRRNMADYQGLLSLIPITMHNLELTGLLDRYLSSRRSG